MIKRDREKMIGRTVISMAIDGPTLQLIDDYCYEKRLDRGYFMKIAAVEYLKTMNN